MSYSGSVLSRRTLCAVAVLAFVACDRSKSKPRDSTLTVSAAPVPAAALEPLIDWRDLDSLPVPSYGHAVVWVPVGTTTPRPIVLGVHGNADTPEALCSALHDIVRTRAFVLCPRGVRSERDFLTFTSPQTLALEVEAAIRALDRRFPGYVDRDGVMYVGFSRGAYLSVPIISTEPARYPRAILIEGGQDAWTLDRINMFGAEGGRRVLFACGQEECRIDARQVANKLEEVGVRTHVAYREAGHVYTGPMRDELKRGFEWVTEGDPRWR